MLQYDRKDHQMQQRITDQEECTCRHQCDDGQSGKGQARGGPQRAANFCLNMMDAVCACMTKHTNNALVT